MFGSRDVHEDSSRRELRGGVHAGVWMRRDDLPERLLHAEHGNSCRGDGTVRVNIARNTIVSYLAAIVQSLTLVCCGGSSGTAMPNCDHGEWVCSASSCVCYAADAGDATN